MLGSKNTTFTGYDTKIDSIFSKRIKDETNAKYFPAAKIS